MSETPDYKRVELVWPGKKTEVERPDFIVRTPTAHYIVETKGWEDLEVPRKDMRARRWCEDATSLSGQSWQYVKVTDSLFRSRNWASFTELTETAAIR
jgi:hypothetical protein